MECAFGKEWEICFEHFVQRTGAGTEKWNRFWWKKERLRMFGMQGVYIIWGGSTTPIKWQKGKGMGKNKGKQAERVTCCFTPHNNSTWPIDNGQTGQIWPTNVALLQERKGNPYIDRHYWEKKFLFKTEKVKISTNRVLN